MKAEERKQLETNVLADRLGKIVQALKQGPNRTMWIVGGVVVAAVVLYFVWNYFAKSSEEKSSTAWVQLMRLLSGESLTPSDEKGITPSIQAELEKFAKDHEGTSQARIARFDLSNLALAEGEKRLGPNQELPLEDVRRSADLYEKLQSETTDYPVLHQLVILRCGKARETLGEFDKALEKYRLLIKDYPKSSFLDEAKDGEERLKEGSARRQELERVFREYSRKP